ncbi:hypothetical protein SAMN06297129_2782 [Pseudooceanicola antarcticus]|uniref:Type IV pilus biogenesis n=1 Tax=Pseudooceanicola antarcticus TaxID=1247613 RepID=A0A285J1P6_9RHOB|nr:hypothetical protein [Pseudooceanicola antarcticus]PJE29815.1 hypothetical protein CVM39_07895 [Pseudooceanicola antarcticus]SNY54250.1 hypothetical protein SAMN06297129_2782 [Pseudooceanicola antarcticus]
MANDPATLATQEKTLPLRELTLIGTMTGPEGPEALLRRSNGKIARARQGEKLDGLQITRIGNGVLTGVLRGRSFTMTLPGS